MFLKANTRNRFHRSNLPNTSSSSVRRANTSHRQFRRDVYIGEMDKKINGRCLPRACNEAKEAPPVGFAAFR